MSRRETGRVTIPVRTVSGIDTDRTTILTRAVPNTETGLEHTIRCISISYILCKIWCFLIVVKLKILGISSFPEDINDALLQFGRELAPSVGISVI